MALFDHFLHQIFGIRRPSLFIFKIIFFLGGSLFFRPNRKNLPRDGRPENLFFLKQASIHYDFSNHKSYAVEKYIYANLSPKDLEYRFNGNIAKFVDTAKCYMNYANCDIIKEVAASRQVKANVT